MYRVLPALALAGALTAVVAGCAAAPRSAPARHKPPASYYLALGDSLAVGVQPDAAGTSVETRSGYADQLYATLRRSHPGLRLVKLGCPGETTVTLMKGGICAYRGGSQLAAAVSFLHAHRARVSLVTIDIGANDADGCVTRLSFGNLASCLSKSIPQVTTNLTKILTRLRQADPKVHIIAMSYYLPALAQWRNGVVGKAVARVSEMVIAGYNVLLNRVYTAYRVRVADVFGAFHTADFGQQVTVPGFGTLPRNVAAICQWTWECAAPPRGPNVHANQAGYQVIAHAFLRAGASAQRPGSS
jgi:lysophospholipase L1-like esterase